MPNIQSARKRMRSDLRKRLQNRSALSELHTLYRKLLTQAPSGTENIQEQARHIVSKLDKAVSHGIIPHRRADRKKALIAKLLANKIR